MTDLSRTAGVRGWLLLLCIALTIVYPLIALAATIPLWPHLDDPPETGVLWLFLLVLTLGTAAFSFYAGWSLWAVRSGAVAIARIFLITQVLAAGAIWAPLANTAGITSPAASEALRGVIFATAYAGIWIWYLKSSARVRATYIDRASLFDAYFQPRALQMLVLGFSSGIPFFLVGNTLSYWLAEQNISLTAIGIASGVGLAYSLKVFWAPLIDRVDAPLLGFLGRRRSWIFFAQILIASELIGMAALGLNHGPMALVGLALAVAFSSATQDIVIDAWRIETATNKDELGLLTSTATFGYRMAVLATDALILILADHIGWQLSYGLFGVLTALCMIATWVAPEPANAEAVMAQKDLETPLYSWRGLSDAIAGPFIAFFEAHGVLALLMLMAIALYRLPDFVMGPMTNPFYHSIGLTKSLVGEVRATIGLVASLAGIAAGGFFTLRFGHLTALIVGGVLQAVSIAAFGLLAHPGLGMPLFFAVMASDSFSTSFAGIVLVAYMSSLTTLGYTATQYALLASAYSFIGKIGKIVSGAIIDALKSSLGLMDAYAVFFIAAGLIGIPGVVLFVILGRIHRLRNAAA